MTGLLAEGCAKNNRPSILAEKGKNAMNNAYWVIPLAGFAGWVFGAVWYTVLGKAWQAALGMDPEGCKGKKMPLAPMMTSLSAAIVMAGVLGLLLQTGMGTQTWTRGVEAGLIVGLGFLLPANLVNNMFQQKQPMVTVIDGAHWVLALVIEGAILGALL
jgi:hypothetical protein